MKRHKIVAAVMAISMCMNMSIMPSAMAAENQEVTIKIKHPGDGEDASPAIQAAIEKAKRVKGPVTLEFEAGKEYEVWPETAYYNTGYYITNTVIKQDNPDGERWSAIYLKDMDDVTIDGNGSLLMIHGVMTPILIDESENITFKDFSLDYARPTVSEFTVLEKESDYVEVKVHDDSFYELRDTDNDGRYNHIQWLGEKKRSNENERYWSSTATLMQEWDPVNETVRRISMYGWGDNIIDEGNNVLRMEFPNGSSYKEGCTYQVRDGVRDQVGTFIHRSKDVTFEDCNFHYMHGLGIVGQYSENITLNRIDCSTREETGRTCAGFADFVQMSGCKGDILIENSHFKGNQDDTFNIHGTHLRIVEADEAGQKLKVRFMHNQSWGFQAFEEGDEIEFIDGSTLVPYGSNTVRSFKRLNDTDIELTLEEALPSDIELNWDAVENVTWTPNVTIRNNVSEYVPTRGVLCTTRGKVLIEGNTFKKQGMAAILLEDDARGWFESGLIRDMTIKDNTFIDCVTPQIHSNPQTSTPNDPEKTVHSNIAITGNTFTGRAVTLNAISTKNLLIEDNVFPEAGGNITLTGCNGFEIVNNENQSGISSTNCINEKSLKTLTVDPITEDSDLPREGMTATANSEWLQDTTENGGGDPPYPAQYVLDGKNDTFWSTDWTNPPAGNISIEIDLNGQKEINRISYLPRQDQPYARILGYEIYANNESGSYEKVAEGDWEDTYDLKYADFDTTIKTDKVKLVVTTTSLSWDKKNVVMGAEISFHNTKELPIGKNIKVQASAVGETGALADLSEAVFTYESSDPTIAVVNKDGVVTGKGEGTAQIAVTVTAYGTTLSQTVPVTVSGEEYIVAESIDILEVSETEETEIQMSATITPQEAFGDVKWKAETVSSQSGAEAVIDENTGMLTMSGEGRVEVTAYSVNNPAVRDTVSVVFTKKEAQTSKTWEWVRENPAAWFIDEDGKLNIAMETGDIWSKSTAKNILLTPVDSEDYEIVVKMNSKPQKDYSESGIIMYVDDQNYVVLSRKAHSGYRPGELNIFSLLAKVEGNPWESPSENVVADDEGENVYLKLTKSGNLYSGYYSTDGNDWKTIYENKVADLGGKPKAGMISYVGLQESETAVYEEFSVNGEKYPLEELKVITGAENGKVTDVGTLEARKVTAGTQFENIRLPRAVKVVWNDSYEETLPVTWQKGSYNGDEIGTYTVDGILQRVSEGSPSAKIQIIVTADKSALYEAVRVANEKVEAAYTSESWQALALVLEKIIPVLEDDTVPQADVDSYTEELNMAIQNLKQSVNYDSLKEVLAESQAVLEDTKEILYEEVQPEVERKNGYYSLEKAQDLSKAETTVNDFLEVFRDLEEMGDVDEFLTESEKAEMAGVGGQLIAALEAFKLSKTEVETEDLELALKDAEQLLENNFTTESWQQLQNVIQKITQELEEGDYTAQEIESLEKEMGSALGQLKRVYMIQIIQTTGGTIIATPNEKVIEGDNVTLKVVPTEGYELKTLIVNGQNVETESGVYIVQSVQDNLTVTAEFMKDDAETPGNGGSDPEQPDVDNPSGGQLNGSDFGKTESDSGVESVKTGDSGNVSPALMVVGSLLIVLYVVYRKKYERLD